MNRLHRRLISPFTRLANLILLLALLATPAGGQPASASAADAALSERKQASATVIQYGAAGFAPAEVTIQPGESVTWRNTTAAPLALQSGLPHRAYLPLVASAGGGPATASLPGTTAGPILDTVIAAGGEYTVQFSAAGSFSYFAATQPASTGTIHVAATQPALRCDEVTPGAGTLEKELPGVLYATAADRTLLRWYWGDCTTARFAVYRSQDGGPERLVATVEPVTDPAAAEALLNTTDPRWPDLANYFDGRFLRADDFSAEQRNPSVTDLYHYLYTNSLAGALLTNQYYPLALMLGWGYLDTDIVPGANYTYRVVALEGRAHGAELGSVELSAGQRTPLPAPTGLVSGTLDLESWDGNWGRYQRNRRYDGQIYLNWNAGHGLAAVSAPSPALAIGYDVFRATQLADDGSIVAAEKVVPPDAESDDAIVVPGPMDAGDGPEYMFRYAPGDYATHTFCVAPRDLFNQPIEWPQDASRCSAPVSVAARDFLPPAPPTDVRANALDNSAQVTIRWAHSDPADVARFIIQRTQDMHCAADDCWTDLATVSGNSTSWIDAASPCTNDPLTDEGCWYRVVARDAAGNRSAPSQMVYAINHDTQPPEQLDMEQYNCDERNSANCVDIHTPAVSIRVNCRLSPAGEELFIAEVSPAQYIGLNMADLIRSVYQPPFDLEDVACRLILVDEYGNLSDIDDSPTIVIDVDSDIPDQLAQPVITEIATVLEAPGDWAATVRWSMAGHPMLGSFVVERTHVASGAVVQFAMADGSVRSFDDSDVEQGERYTYVVRAVASAPDVNDTLSEPRSHRILPGEDRPLVELPWAAATPERDAATATTTLQVSTLPLGDAQPTLYAVFRSLHEGHDYTQITPVLQSSGAAIYYADAQAQRACYFYVIVTFGERDGEPTGYTEPRQPAGCAQLAPAVYTPGPDAAPEPFPGRLCATAAHSISPAYNFRFAGGFEVVVESLNDDYTGPGRVDGAGWLLLETLEETIPVPMTFSNLTVDAGGNVCSGTATVDLSGIPGGGLTLQAQGGWAYRLREIVLQPRLREDNVALATLDLYSGDAYTNFEAVNGSATRIELEDAHLLNSLRFSYSADFGGRGDHTCAHPTVAFRLETLPLDVIPSGDVSIDPDSIELSSACTLYVDRFTPGLDPMASPPMLGPGARRSMNDGYLAEPMFGTSVSLTPAGLDGNFSNDTDLEWYTAYPYALRVQLSDGIALSIVDGQIASGSTGAGDLYTSYHQTVEGDERLIIQSAFSGLTIGSRGDLTGTTSLGAISWDAFSMPAAPAGSWTLYLGALTTPGLPAFHDAEGRGRSIMWQASPAGAAPVAIPGGALPGLLEPGLNRRQAGATLEWDNCGTTASFTNVAIDAYLRHAGVTQRYIPVYDAGSTLEVYGYRFIPERFDLHFLDNALLEHDIRGSVDLPFPSDIEVRLVNIELIGDPANPGAGEAACIGGGQVPDGQQDKTLAYWDVDARFTNGEFRQGPAETVLWLGGDIRNLPHLTLGDAPAILPAELAFNPDGNFRDDPLSGPRYDRPDYRFQGFPYLLERFRLSDWLGNGQGEQPAWETSATAIAQPLAATWNSNGFVGLRGVPVAPYFGPVAIDAGEAGDNTVFAAWDANLTGFAAQPHVSKEWVKLARVNLTFDYDHLVHAYDAASGAGLFVGFETYRFVPDSYAIPAAVPGLNLNQLQVLQLDTGAVIAPAETNIYLGLSSGVATMRALAQAQGLDMPALPVMQAWASRLTIEEAAASVYIAQTALIWQQHGEFDYHNTTNVLDTLSDASVTNLIDQNGVGGRTQGLLALRGVNIRRLRGVVELEGQGLETQVERFQLSTQVEIKGRNQSVQELATPPQLPANPAIDSDPPLFYAERMTLSIERHGDYTLVGKNVQSSTFKDTLDSFDATLVINATEPQFEGGLTLNGLHTNGITIDNASAVLGVGSEVNYLGLSFDGHLQIGVDQALIGGDLLAGVVNPNSLVLQHNFADAMAEIEEDLEGEQLGDLSALSGFYLRAYGGQIPIIGNSCMLSLKGDAEIAFWYWKLPAEENVGGLLKPAVYGEVLCTVQARGSLRLEYHYADSQDRFEGEGYVAGGIGLCEPASWGNWNDRWWNDGGCLQAGAGLVVSYATSDGWSVDYGVDAERLFGD